MLTVLVTSDWRLGRTFRRFADAKRLDAARLETVARLFALAAETGVRAVVCAGDLFESPRPSDATRRAFVEVLTKLDWKDRAVVLVPGDRDALVEGSVWTDPAFLDALPPFVTIAAAEVTTLELAGGVTLLATPCTSHVRPPAPFPAREGAGLRFGVQHVPPDARPERGDLDVLALGGSAELTFLAADKRTFFCGTPEPMDFAAGAGHVALVTLAPERGQVLVEGRRVAAFTWERRKVGSLDALRQLAEGGDLSTRVLHLELGFSLRLLELEQLDEVLSKLRTREEEEGLLLELETTSLTLDPRDRAPNPDWPAVLQRSAKELLTESENPARRAVALRALTHLSAQLRSAR